MPTPAAAPLFRCPVCHEALSADDDDKTWRCANRHSYDVARDRTVHLLPAGHGKTRVVGDSAEMLAARQRFLGAGHYRALTNALANVVVTAVSSTPSAFVVDLGCGEATHLRGIVDAVAATPHDVVIAGLDLSKDAVKLAARTVREARFVVGDSRLAIPLCDGVVDVALVVFAPRGVAELARVLRVGGVLVVAIPEPEHLAQIRATWGGIGIADEKRGRTIGELAGAFDLVDEIVVTADAVDGAALADLLTMTPSRRHLDDEVLATARGGSGAVVDLRVRVLRFQRTRSSQPPE